MKISKETKKKLRSKLRTALEKQMRKQLQATSVRKSVAAELNREDFDFNDKEELAKFYRGALTGNWSHADAQYKTFKAMQKALGERLGTTGGFLVPPQLDNELIEYIRGKVAVRNVPGVRTYAMKSNVLQMPRLDTGASASWGGENETISSSAVEFGQVEMVLRKVVGKVAVSNELIEDADPSIVDLINRDLTDAVAEKVDQGLLEGTGGAEPLGLYYQPNIVWTDLSGTPDFDDFYDAIYQVRRRNHEITAWISHPRLENTLLKLRTGDSQYLRPYVEGVSGNEPRLPQLLGLPVIYTTNVSITGMPGTNESYCIGADWKQVIIGDRNGLRLSSSTDEAFSKDQTIVRAVYRVGLMLRHPEAVVVVKGIQA